MTYPKISQAKLYTALNDLHNNGPDNNNVRFEKMQVDNFGFTEDGRVVKTTDPNEKALLRNAINEHCSNLSFVVENDNEKSYDTNSNPAYDKDYINLGILLPRMLKTRKISKLKQVCTYIIGKCQSAFHCLKEWFNSCFSGSNKSSHDDPEKKTAEGILGSSPTGLTHKDVNSTKEPYVNFTNHECTTYEDWMNIKKLPQYAECTTENPTDVMPNYVPGDDSHCGFYLDDNQHGPYCYTNYHLGSLIKIGDKQYKTGEHLFQSKKYELSDPDRAKAIRDAHYPGQAKKLASPQSTTENSSYSKNPPFNEKSWDIWDKVSNTVMLFTLYAKASQDPIYRKTLYESASKSQQLYELSPYDKKWGLGIGLNKISEMHEQNQTYDSTTCGTNWLGKDHMHVGKHLFQGKIEWLGEGVDPIHNELANQYS